MIRKSMAAVFSALGLVLVAGCNNPSRDQQEAQRAQIEADQKKAEAQREADQKIREARQEAQNDIQKAQQTAEDKKAEATQSLSREQMDYREKVQKEVADLDKKIDEMRVTAATETGRAKDDADRALKDVSVRRDTLVADLKSMDTVAAKDWVVLRGKIDHDMDDFRTSVRTASSRIRNTGRAVDTTRTTTPKQTRLPRRNPKYALRNTKKRSLGRLGRFHARRGVLLFVGEDVVRSSA